MAENLEEMLYYRYQCGECGKDELYEKEARAGENYLCEECQHPMYLMNTVDLSKDINTGHGRRRRG